MKDKKLAILILSCDKFRDVWTPFLNQFRRFFPSEDYQIYVGSNSVRCAEQGVIPIMSGDDPDWSTSYKRILAQIKEPKLFVILEDQFLASPIDSEGFQEALSFLIEKNALHIKYWANPLPNEVTDNPRIGIYHQGAPYRATVCGFWDREYLMSLLIEGENPWNFEILGSYRTSYSDGFYGLMRPLCENRNMIEKGCWIPQSVAWAREEGIVLDLDKRPLLEGGNQFVSRVKMLYFDLMLQVPWRWRVALMNKLRRVLISY
jgi:hypothetical protein